MTRKFRDDFDLEDLIEEAYAVEIFMYIFDIGASWSSQITKALYYSNSDTYLKRMAGAKILTSKPAEQFNIDRETWNALVHSRAHIYFIGDTIQARLFAEKVKCNFNVYYEKYYQPYK